MAIAEAIKNYIAEKYGDGNCVTTTGCDDLGKTCMLGADLKTPLPVGYTKADICKAEVYDWCYQNIGWCKGAPAEVPEAIKIYLAEQYGAGNCITSTGCDDFGKVCMVGTPLKTPLPSGYTRDDICKAEVYDWCYLNIGWCTTAEKGYLKINTSPVGASVRVGTKECGLTPVLACELSTGWKTVTITKTGYDTETRTVEIAVGATSDLGTITLTPVAVAGKGWVNIGTYPGGFSIKIDGVTKVTSSPSLPGSSRIEISAGVSHTIEISQMYFEPETGNVYVREGEETAMDFFPDYSGPGGATLVISAWDEETGEELRGATFGVYGISGEEKYVLPVTFPVKPGDYKIIVNYPGYEEGVATGTVSAGETKEVKVMMNVARPWVEIEVVERLPTEAWITDIDVPSPMAYDIVYDISAKLIITKSGSYQIDLTLHEKPSGWDGKLASLPPARPEVIQSGIEALVPYPTTKKTIKWTWRCLSSIPPGTYIIVSNLFEIV